jgi:hypothetical protein
MMALYVLGILESLGYTERADEYVYVAGLAAQENHQ